MRNEQRDIVNTVVSFLQEYGGYFIMGVYALILLSFIGIAVLRLYIYGW